MTTPDLTPEVVERLRRTHPQHIDDHGGYGKCGGLGKVWVDDDEASNFYEGGLCRHCASTPKPINPDGPEAADLVEALLAERAADKARLSHLEEQARKDAEALEPFAKLADDFDGLAVVEVCQPHPGNPSSRIEPLLVERLHAARARLSDREGK